MTRPELRTLDKIIGQIERLRDKTDDSVAQQQLADSIHILRGFYNDAKRACDATEAA